MGTSNRGRMENCSFSVLQRCILIDAQLGGRLVKCVSIGENQCVNLKSMCHVCLHLLSDDVYVLYSYRV